MSTSIPSKFPSTVLAANTGKLPGRYKGTRRRRELPIVAEWWMR